ncbi:MAG: phenylalanine--tRNA ligase subunit beta, partial [Lachnospiraceae bacterium]|nr:phenylalanine--tRNA ligase subunit beta [Lachnospiraceae bacterium]
IYIPKALPLTERPDEYMQLTLGMYGNCDFYDMKGVVEVIISNCGLRNKLDFVVSKRPYLHPGRQADIMYNDIVIGYIGEVHPEVTDNYSIKEKTYVAVIDMRFVVEYADFNAKYKGLPKFPAVTRDISLVMKKGILAGQIENIIRKKGGKLLEHVQLFDVYEGESIGCENKSLAYSIRFRDSERTLEDKDVNAVMDKIISALAELGAVLRS